MNSNYLKLIDLRIKYNLYVKNTIKYILNP